MNREGGTEERLRVRITVSGRVQGVGFRYATVREAQRLNLSGWVRNTHDGKVEILAEGRPEMVRRLLTWCSGGPPMAEVAGVEHREEPREAQLGPFDVRF